MIRIEREELLQHIENCLDLFNEDELSQLAIRIAEDLIARARKRLRTMRPCGGYGYQPVDTGPPGEPPTGGSSVQGPVIRIDVRG